MKTKEIKEVEAKRWPVTILLIIIGIVILIPLYMAIVIAVKQPSEMTNDVAGALALPHTWSLSNFAEAIKITDFWHTASNSLILQWEVRWHVCWSVRWFPLQSQGIWSIKKFISSFTIIW